MNISFNLILSLLLFTCFLPNLKADIEFKEMEIAQALELGKKKNKLIFVDTYATWCGPCKMMDRIFEQKAVSDFYNSNFVNIKIDMDSPLGESIVNRYGVVWLPTLLIIDHQSGQVISKIDRLVDSQELIRIGRDAMSGVSRSTSPGRRDNPFAGGTNDNQNKIEPEATEEVVYVHDDRVSSGRPQIMYHEAYLHLQLMDGKHGEVVKKYLSTQDDWSTEKNIKFIFDFLNSTQSAEFDYFIKNRGRFVEVIGESRILTSIAILVQQRLYQGFPRPGLDEAIRLYDYIDHASARANGYKYYLSSLDIAGRELEYLQVATLYLEDVMPGDHVILHKLVRKKMARINAHQTVNDDIEHMNRAIALDEENPLYYKTLSELYLNKGNRNEALENIDRAIQIAGSSSPQLNEILAFKKKLVIN